jgi:DNA-binding response OmpR family regulator
MRLLLVEDDTLLGDGIRAGLNQDGYLVDWVKDGDAAEHALQSEKFDLVILDINLPKRSGLQVLADLRARADNTPVLILTARDTTAERVSGLDSGADDYLVKPFDLDELSARLRALLRRSSGRSVSNIVSGDLVLDPLSRDVSKDGVLLTLSHREFALLHIFMENIGKVMSRARLEEALYGWSGEPDSNALEVHIHHLRKKVGNDRIRTARGVGYVFEKCDEERQSP